MINFETIRFYSKNSAFKVKSDSLETNYDTYLERLLGKFYLFLWAYSWNEIISEKSIRSISKISSVSYVSISLNFWTIISDRELAQVRN